MGVLDKFLDIMKLSDDDDDYDSDDFFDEDDGYDDFDESKPRKKLFKKENDNFDDDIDVDKRMKSTAKSASKVTPMRQPVKRSSGMEVCVIKPTSVDNSREVTETLLSGRTVILNLEGLDLEVAQRIIDFTSGATFAINGNLQKISNYIFLVTPASVEITGDLQDLLSDSFEVPAMKPHF